MTVSRKKPPATEIVTLATPPAPFASGDVVDDRFTVIELYGSGPLGFTYRCRDVDGKKVALKIIAHDIAPTKNERVLMVGEMQKMVGRAMDRIAVPIEAAVVGQYA